MAVTDIDASTSGNQMYQRTQSVAIVRGDGRRDPRTYLHTSIASNAAVRPFRSLRGKRIEEREASAAPSWDGGLSTGGEGVARR